MDVKVIPAEKWLRYIEVTIPPEEFEPRVAEELENYRKRAHVDGFRKGKAPLQLVKKIYGDAIREKTIEDLLPKALTDASDQHQLKIVGSAHVEEAKYDQQKGLHFRASVEVSPEIELRQYKGLQFEKTVYEVGEQDAAEALENIREQYAKLRKIDGEAQAGHIVLVDLQQIDTAGVPIVGAKYENRYFQIAADGADGNEFTKPLIGAKVGESRKLHSREEPPEGTKADAPTFYQATIKEIFEKEVPAFDDAFAREVGFINAGDKVETLEQLKEAIRGQLAQRAERRSREALHREMIDDLLKTNPFDLPEKLTESYVASFIKSVKSQFENVPEDEWKAGASAAAIRRLRWEFLLEQIAQAEGIEVTDEELRESIIQSALASGQEPQRLLNQIMNDEKKREKMREDLHEQKVLRHLEQQMKIHERRVPFADRDKQHIITV